MHDLYGILRRFRLNVFHIYQKPVKPAVHDESDDHDTIADEKDDELEEFIEEGGMEKILDMFQVIKFDSCGIFRVTAKRHTPLFE